MKSKTYFISEGALNIFFGVLLIFFPALMTQEYIVDSALRNSVTDFLTKLMGLSLIGIAIPNFYARNLDASPLRYSIILMGAFINLSYMVVHILAFKNGIEKEMVWLTIAMHGVWGIWGLLLLKNK